MTSKNKAQDTLERLRNASAIGIKVSAVYNKANLSPFRIKSLVSGAKYFTGNSPKTSKPLTDAEADAINAVLDEIKAGL